MSKMSLEFDEKSGRYDMDWEGDWGIYGWCGEKPKEAVTQLLNNLHLIDPRLDVAFDELLPNICRCVAKEEENE